MYCFFITHAGARQKWTSIQSLQEQVLKHVTKFLRLPTFIFTSGYGRRSRPFSKVRQTMKRIFYYTHESATRRYSVGASPFHLSSRIFLDQLPVLLYLSIVLESVSCCAVLLSRCRSKAGIQTSTVSDPAIFSPPA